MGFWFAIVAIRLLIATPCFATSSLPWLKPDMQADFEFRVLQSAPVGSLTTENRLDLLHAGMMLELQGDYFFERQKLSSPSIEFSGLPSGPYQIRLKSMTGELLAEHRFIAPRRKKTKIAVRLLGEDHVSEKPYLYEIEEAGGNLEGGLRIVRTEGHEWIFENGTRRFWHAGQALIVDHRGSQVLQLDADDDRLVDELDPDYEGDEPSRLGLLMGKIQRPVLLDLEVEPAFSREWEQKVLGLQIEARISRAGGQPLTSVMLSVFQSAQLHVTQPLLDDGSLLDVNASMPHHQISGDQKRGDGVFTGILLMRGHAFRPSRGFNLHVDARNRQGLEMAGRTVAVRLPELGQGGMKENVSPTSEAHIHASFSPLPVKDGLNVKFSLKAPKSAEVMMHSSSGSRLIFEQKMDLKLTSYSDTIAIPSGSTGFLTVEYGLENLFYTGFKAP